MVEETAMTQMEDPQAPGSGWAGGWPQTAREFEAFVDIFQNRLVYYAFRRVGDLHEAEDIVQEVFLKAYAERAKMAGVGRVKPYLYRMAANACTDRLRRGGRQTISLEAICAEAIEDDRAVAACERVAAAEELRRIERLLAGLPTRQAEVIRLRVLDELSFDEIAELHGCPPATIKSRLRYGLDKLRRLISRTKEGQS